MIRSTIALAAGFTATMVVTFGTGELMFPDAISQIDTRAEAPVHWLLVEQFSYAAGSLAGGVTVRLITAKGAMGLAVVVGGSLTLFFLLPGDSSDPLWLETLEILIPVPCATLGAAAAGARLHAERSQAN